MATTLVALSVSLDGFIAGSDDGPELPLGRGGERLFTWMNAGPESNRINRWLVPPDASVPIVRSWSTDCGAILSGRRTFDIANGWSGGHPVDVPIIVLTHQPPSEGDWSPRVEFATELDDAVERAGKLAGDKYVSISGASIAQQLLRDGRLDEVHLDLTPCLLGGGVRLLDHFGPEPVDLEQVSVTPSEGVTHLRYRVVKA
jgi:dihydrofolate reductase